MKRKYCYYLTFIASYKKVLILNILVKKIIANFSGTFTLISYAPPNLNPHNHRLESGFL